MDVDFHFLGILIMSLPVWTVQVYFDATLLQPGNKVFLHVVSLFWNKKDVCNPFTADDMWGLD